MSMLFKTVLILSVLLGLLLAWFYSVWDRAELKYKLTYEVQTPFGLRVGSSVIAVYREDTSKLPLPATGVGHSVEGEAVVVDLGNGKFLFSLIQENAYALPQNTFSNLMKEGMGIVEFTRLLSETQPSAQLPNSEIPLLVRFDDINNPTSVKKVDPSDLAAVFGEDYSLRSITLEITDEDVTVGEVENVLGWLETVWPNKLDGNRYETIEADNRFANSLSTGNFSTEIKR